MTDTKERDRKKRKKKFKRKLRNKALAVLGPLWIKFWIGSVRYRVHTPVNVHPFHDNETPQIYTFWHQRMLAFVLSHRNSGVRILISSHGDGEMIAQTVDKLGLQSVRGSTTRGGVQALKELLNDLGSGKDYAFTPDGPRGPKHVFQKGAVYFASKSGLPIICASVSYDRFWELRTWDKFIIPKFRAKGVVHVNPPIYVPPNLSDDELETWRQKLEVNLNQVTQEADENFAKLYEKAKPWKFFHPKKGPFQPTRKVEPEPNEAP